VRTRLKYLFAIPYGGMSGGRKPDLPEWPMTAAVPQAFDWFQDMEDRVKRLEDRVAALEREIRGMKEGATA